MPKLFSTLSYVMLALTVIAILVTIYYTTLPTNAQLYEALALTVVFCILTIVFAVVSYFKEVTYEEVAEYVESEPAPPMFGKAVKAGIALLFGGVISCIIGFLLVGTTVISLFSLVSSMLIYAPITLIAGIILFLGGLLMIVISIIIFIIKGLQWVIKN